MAKCSFEGCFAVNSLGNAYCWGQNQINKLESPYPIPLEDLYGWNINDLSPGFDTLLAIVDNKPLSFTNYLILPFKSIFLPGTPHILSYQFLFCFLWPARFAR